MRDYNGGGGGRGGERRRESSIVSETIFGLCGDIFDEVLISETVWTLPLRAKMTLR